MTRCVKVSEATRNYLHYFLHAWLTLCLLHHGPRNSRDSHTLTCKCTSTHTHTLKKTTDTNIHGNIDKHTKERVSYTQRNTDIHIDTHICRTLYIHLHYITYIYVMCINATYDIKANSYNLCPGLQFLPFVIYSVVCSLI